MVWLTKAHKKPTYHFALWRHKWTSLHSRFKICVLGELHYWNRWIRYKVLIRDLKYWYSFSNSRQNCKNHQHRSPAAKKWLAYQLSNQKSHWMCKRNANSSNNGSWSEHVRCCPYKEMRHLTLPRVLHREKRCFFHKILNGCWLFNSFDICWKKHCCRTATLRAHQHFHACKTKYKKRKQLVRAFPQWSKSVFMIRGKQASQSRMRLITSFKNEWAFSIKIKGQSNSKRGQQCRPSYV